VAFEIEEITKKAANSIKKNPLPWAIGGCAALLGVVFLTRRGGEGYLTSAYPETPLMPDDLGDVGSGTGEPGGLSDTALLDLLAQMEASRAADLQEIAAQQQTFLQSLASVFSQYAKQQEQYQQYPQQPYPPTMQPNSELMAMAEYLYSTPSLIFSEKGVEYTPAQVGTMYDWAMEENAAISRGAAGTSALPTSLAGSDLIVTYYPSGHVAFTPRGQERPADPGPSNFQQQVEARGVQAAQQLSGITGRSGTIEQQLSGMSQSEKLDALRSVGLIQ
jgi:hypothetical protein